MPPPMAVRLAADLRPSADGSAFRGPHISGGRPAAGSQRAYILDSSATQPAFCSLGWDRQTEGSRYRLMLPCVGGIIKENKKLSYRRVTARCVLSVVILPIATQQYRNYLYDKS